MLKVIRYNISEMDVIFAAVSQWLKVGYYEGMLHVWALINDMEAPSRKYKIRGLKSGEIKDFEGIYLGTIEDVSYFAEGIELTREEKKRYDSMLAVVLAARALGGKK